jgi:hypothetical protein
LRRVPNRHLDPTTEAPFHHGRRTADYRVEVLAIMGALADVGVGVRRILGYFEGEDEDEAEEEDLPDA